MNAFLTTSLRRLRPFVFGVLSIAALATSSTVNATPALFGDGAKLVYAVSSGATVLIGIENAPNAGSGAAFRFLFPAEGPAGTVRISADAMETATTLVNGFSPGDTALSQETSAWLSRQVFAAAKAGKPVVLDLGFNDGVKTTFTLDPKASRPLRVATDPGRYDDTSRLVDTIVLRSTDGQTLRVVDNPANPLIVDLNTGSFRVELALHL